MQAESAMRIRDPRASAVKTIRPETVILLADLFQRNSGHDRQNPLYYRIGKRPRYLRTEFYMHQA